MGLLTLITLTTVKCNTLEIQIDCRIYCWEEIVKKEVSSSNFFRKKNEINFRHKKKNDLISYLEFCICFYCAVGLQKVVHQL